MYTHKLPAAECPITKLKGSQQLYLLHQPIRKVEEDTLAHADSTVTRHLAKKKSGNTSDQQLHLISRDKAKRNKVQHQWLWVQAKQYLKTNRCSISTYISHIGPSAKQGLSLDSGKIISQMLYFSNFLTFFFFFILGLFILYSKVE